MLSEKQIVEIEQKIGYNFKNKKYVLTAFTHSSFAYTHGIESNERLEFLGDSVLNFCTTKFLYENFDFDEGVSSKIKAYLVSSEYVSKYINQNGLEKYILCSNFDPHASTNVMGDLYEAIIGAMLLDGGVDVCDKFINRSLNFSKDLVLSVHTKVRDYKTELQEFLQQNGKEVPNYVLVEKTGPAHKPSFKVAVEINGEKLATASGSSKKEAENISAKLALEKLKN